MLVCILILKKSPNQKLNAIEIKSKKKQKPSEELKLVFMFFKKIKVQFYNAKVNIINLNFRSLRLLTMTPNGPAV